MKLYSGPLSMFGAKAEIAALEKGLDTQREFVPFSIAELYSPKHDDVARINPKLQVPVLIDGDLEIFDSTQIFEYFEDSVPNPPLWPTDKKQRARARLLELKSDEVFFPNVVQLMPGNRTPERQAETEQALADIQSYYTQMNDLLGETEYLAETYSYADIAFFMAQFFAAFLGAPAKDDQNRLIAWRKRIAARPAVAEVHGAMVRYLGENGIPVPEM